MCTYHIFNFRMSSTITKQRKLWTDESMAAAVENVVSGKLGLREASRLYNLPIESLRRRVVGINEVRCRPGPPTVLSDEVEDQLANYLVKMADMGYGLSRETVMKMAFDIAEKTKSKHPFKDGTAGRAWFDGFRRRHPKLTIRAPQPLSHCRALCANRETIDDFFGKLGAIYGKLNLITKPMQVFNCDETGITVVHKPGKVVAELGRRNVYAVTSAERGKIHTVLSCVSASGYTLPPMMVYPRKKAVPEKLRIGAVPNTLFMSSESGWINSDLFFQWFTFFVENIPPARPVLLLQDGHSSHISIELIELARENDVHLLCLPAHCTHILQPLDVGVFKPFKSYFSKACTNFLAKNPGQVVTTEKLSSLVAEAWPSAFTPINVMAGFKKTGIHPLNPGEVSDRQLGPSRVYHCPTSNEKETDQTIVKSAECEPLLSSSGSPLFSTEKEALFSKRYEEHYDLGDPEYLAWLKLTHPDDINVSVSISDTSSSNTHCSSTVSKASTASGTDLSDILVLPKALSKPKRKKPPALTSQAVCITDAEVLAHLKHEKLEAEQKKLADQEEKERKRLVREEKKKEKEKKDKAKRGRKKGGKKQADIDDAIADLKIFSEEDDNAVCPKCGKVYPDDGGLWVCCDKCDNWFDFECTNIPSRRRIPEIFICDSCV